jgi:hypothetical protein
MMTHTRKIRRFTRAKLTPFLFFAVHQNCSSPAAIASRRRGNDLGTAIKYLRNKTSGAVGIGLCNTAKYPRRTTGAAAGSGLGTTLNYLRGTAG